MTRQLRMRWRSFVLSANGPTAPPSPPKAVTVSGKKKGPPIASTAARRLVAATLAEFMRADGTGAYPSERTLETMTGLDRRTVRVAVVALIAGGWLSVRDAGHKGKFGKAIREYAACIPDKGNGSVNARLQVPRNGTVTDPLNESVNGATATANGTVADSQRDNHCPSFSLNQIKKEEGATRSALQGAARAPHTEKAELPHRVGKVADRIEQRFAERRGTPKA